MFSFLLTWYNLPFLIALASSMLFALLQVIGGIADHNADLDLDADIQAHVEAHIELHADTHLDFHATPHHPESHFEHTAQPSGLLAALGVGRVPLALILIALLGSFGATGLIANTLLASALGGYAPLTFPIVLVVAGALTFALTGQISRLARPRRRREQHCGGL